MIYLGGEKSQVPTAEKAKELRAADRTGKAIGARSKQETQSLSKADVYLIFL